LVSLIDEELSGNNYLCSCPFIGKIKGTTTIAITSFFAYWAIRKFISRAVFRAASARLQGWSHSLLVTDN
jgi:hypothetical protein